MPPSDTHSHPRQSGRQRRKRPVSLGHDVELRRGDPVHPHATLFRRPRASAAILIAFSVVFIALRAGSLTRKSATYDEPLHLTAGYLALAEGDYRVDPSHPPFVRMWAALPLLAMDDVKADASQIDRSSA